jgi:hypothetical protein
MMAACPRARRRTCAPRLPVPCRAPGRNQECPAPGVSGPGGAVHVVIRGTWTTPNRAEGGRAPVTPGLDASLARAGHRPYRVAVSDDVRGVGQTSWGARRRGGSWRSRAGQGRRRLRRSQQEVQSFERALLWLLRPGKVAQHQCRRTIAAEGRRGRPSTRNLRSRGLGTLCHALNLRAKLRAPNAAQPAIAPQPRGFTVALASREVLSGTLTILCQPLETLPMSHGSSARRQRLDGLGQSRRSQVAPTIRPRRHGLRRGSRTEEARFWPRPVHVHSPDPVTVGGPWATGSGRQVAHIDGFWPYLATPRSACQWRRIDGYRKRGL